MEIIHSTNSKFLLWKIVSSKAIGLRWFSVYNVRLIGISNTVSDGATKKISSENWKGAAQLTTPGNLSQYLLCNIGLKTQNFTKNVWAHKSTFAFQKFCRFWKPISPWILQTKSQKLHQLLSFASSFYVCSQSVPSEMPSPHKGAC